MILLMKKTLKEEQVILFIEEADPTQERWYGRKVTVDEAKEISGIDNVMFLDSFEGAVDRMMAREDIDSLYFDCYRYQFEDMPDYNMIKAKEFAEKYPGITNEEFVRLLSLTATDLGEPWNKQGFGMLNVRRLLENK